MPGVFFWFQDGAGVQACPPGGQEVLPSPPHLFGHPCSPTPIPAAPEGARTCVLLLLCVCVCVCVCVREREREREINQQAGQEGTSRERLKGPAWQKKVVEKPLHLVCCGEPPVSGPLHLHSSFQPSTLVSPLGRPSLHPRTPKGLTCFCLASCQSQKQEPGWK